MLHRKLLLWMMITVLLLAGCGGDEPEVAAPETAVSQTTSTTTETETNQVAAEATAVSLPTATVEVTAVATIAPTATPAPTEPPEPAAPSGDAKQAVLDALKLSLNSGPYRTVTTITDENGVTELAGDVIPPGQMHIQLTSADGTTEIIFIGDQGWMQSGGSGWIDFPAAQAIGEMTKQMMLDPESAGFQIEDVVFVGPDTVNGEAAWVYTYRSIVGEGSDALESNGKLWISAVTGLPMQQEGESEIGGQKSTVLQIITFDPAITITPPGE